MKIVSDAVYIIENEKERGELADIFKKCDCEKFIRETSTKWFCLSPKDTTLKREMEEKIERKFNPTEMPRSSSSMSGMLAVIGKGGMKKRTRL